MEICFNDGWTFLETPLGTDRAEAAARQSEFQKVNVPHDYQITDARHLYRDSCGWYRKVFSYNEKNKRAFLTFDGVYMDSRIYINGSEVFEWKYGYSSFTVDMTDALNEGENEIMVSVMFQNPNSRWYSGAGIYRDVTLHILEKTYIPVNGIYLSAKPLPQGEDFVLRMETDICGDEKDLAYTEIAGADRTDAVSAEAAAEGKNALKDFAPDTLCMEELQQEDVRIAEAGLAKEESFPVSDADTRKSIRYFLVKKPQRWNLESPMLYTFTINLCLENTEQDPGKKVLQTCRIATGFRSVVFSPEKGLFLNGQHLKLNGVCEHHDLGALGSAFHADAMRRKFRILKEMGVNAVRLTHNMAAEKVLALADEMGILLISEAFDMWEKPKTTYDYARFFKEWHERDVRSWISRDRNHVSVILWSIGNEIGDTHQDAHGQEITRDLLQHVTSFDPYRNAQVTIGSNYMPWENAQKCADIVKIAGYNYSEKYYEAHHKVHKDWCIYGSETSSIVQSRGIYHFPLSAEILAEEDLQCSSLGNSITSWGARSMEQCIATDRDTPYSLGQFLWTGFDYIGEPTPYHTKNSYFGLIDTAGFPKDAYYVWQSAWTDAQKAPMIHIFPYWDFNPGQQIDVRVVSNAPVVELFLNGTSLGKQTLTHAPISGTHLIADYKVIYEAGELLALAYNEDGTILARDRKRSFGSTAVLTVRQEKTDKRIEKGTLLFYEIGAEDSSGYPVENANDLVTVEVTGDGRLCGLDNGDSTDEDSYQGNCRHLFGGRLLAIVEAAKEDANVQVNVRSAGDVPVRKITLFSENGAVFSSERKTILVQAKIEPCEAAYDVKDLAFEAVSDQGVVSGLVDVETSGCTAQLTAKGDGAFHLRCLLRNREGIAKVMSQLDFQADGLGKAYLDPYGFIYGAEYTSSNGNAGNGNEKGFASARDGETIVIFSGIDFGETGSDEMTVPVFALSDEEYPVRIYEGDPREKGSTLLADVIYQKPSIWNVYQEDTWKLAKFVKGITSISFVLHKKVHIKGFSFRRYEKAFLRHCILDADEMYGDSYEKTEDAVLQIGNNCSFVYRGMNFGTGSHQKLSICGKCSTPNTVHVRFDNGETERKEVLAFAPSKDWSIQTFDTAAPAGTCKVTFLFMPGSCFDFKWFLFEEK